MNEIAVNTAKCQILKALEDLEDIDLAAVSVWLCKKYKDDLNRRKAFRREESVLDKIRENLKEITPLQAEYPTENIKMPVVGDQADCTPENTCHVDEFLYTEDDVETLVKQGKIQRQYCVDCKSRNVKDLTFISHSMSKTSLQYIFRVLLPVDLSDKVILDVGSRLGAVIFAAYYFSNARAIIGIEMCKDWCEVVNRMAVKYNLNSNRNEIICSDVLYCDDVIQRSNIIFINVLDFFVEKEEHIKLWRFFKNNINKGSFLVTNRSAEETFEDLDIYEEFSGWLKMCCPFQPENEYFFDMDDFNYGDICLYMVS